jgi:hypothetical protein
MFTLIVRYLAKSVFFLVATIPVSAKIVVFWQNGFPTVDSGAVSHQALQSALQGEEQLAYDSGWRELACSALWIGIPR